MATPANRLLTDLHDRIASSTRAPFLATTKNCLIPLSSIGLLVVVVGVMKDKHSATSLTSSQNLDFALTRLQHAVAAAEFGSFRQAAEALAIRQSTLS
ncbi:hypothetical protein KXV85_003387, partial [Aspergillus fumigatus]